MINPLKSKLSDSYFVPQKRIGPVRSYPNLAFGVKAGIFLVSMHCTGNFNLL